MTRLAAQCGIPPHIAQYPFEIVWQRGVSHAFCLVFIGYRASTAEIPLLWGGYRTSTSHALQGGNAQKRRGGVSHPIGHVETLGERQSIAQKGVRAIDARNSWLEMAQMLQKPLFALPGCQRTSVNTLLCDTLGLAETPKTP